MSHEALNPPSRFKMQLLANSLDAKKTAASATSAGSATRFTGVSLRYACFISGLRAGDMANCILALHLRNMGENGEGKKGTYRATCRCPPNLAARRLRG